MKPRTLHIITFAAVILTMIMTACGPAKNYQNSSRTGKTGKTTLTLKQQDALVKEAKQWVGTRYQYGGHSRKGTDCSGMVMEVYRKVCDVSLPRSSREQQSYCKGVAKKDLTVGDLVFFSTGSSSNVSHVGLYIGNGKMVHASTSRGVIISGLDEKYYQRTYHSSGRVMASASTKSTKTTTKASTPKPSKQASTTTPASVPQPPAAPQVTVQSTELEDFLDAKIDSIYTNMFD